MEALRATAGRRYEILDEIGRGSTGAVYLARDLATGEDVALKTLSEGGSLDDADLERLRRLFLNEASAGSLLSHPGIVRIRDLIDEPGTPEVFLVMDYVSGSSLAETLARPDPLPFDFVVNVVSGVADVLDHVHAHGVVHRDIKPANILIAGGGGVRVTDFGIAELRGQDLGEELQRAGSPAYMAPERVLGTGSDYRGDIWALGVVLYEMLTRRLPFQGESVSELVTRIATEEPAPLDQAGALAIPGIQPILDRALAKEPQDRYQFAGDIARELKAVQAGQMELSVTLPATAIPDVVADDSVPTEEGAAEEGSRFRSLPALFTRLRRLPRWAIAAAALLVLLALWTVSRGPTPGAATRGGAPLVGESPAPRLEYLALLEQARTMLEHGEKDAALALFARAEELSPDARRIRFLRDEVRAQAAREVAAELDLEVAGLVGVGELELAEGRLEAAKETAERALGLRPDDPAAAGLAARVEEARRAAWRRVEEARARIQPPVAPKPAPAPPQPEPLRVVQPIQPPPVQAAPTHSDLKIDFYSELPRGVLTIYQGENQLLRRAFRFVEKRGFMRTRGVSGGFDDQVRVPAGPAALRVYLSLPGHPTEVYRLSGTLPPGAIRVLQVRVDASGKLAVSLH